MTEAVPVKEVQIAEGWGQAAASQILELPSGSRVRYRELDVPELIGLGALDLVDSFTQEALPAEPKKKKPKKIQDNFSDDISRNKEKMGKMMELVDKIVVAAVIEPRVFPLEKDEAPEDGKIYAKLIPFEDRMAIFEKAVVSMGDFLADRQGQAEDVADLANVEDVQSETKPADRDPEQE